MSRPPVTANTNTGSSSSTRPSSSSSSSWNAFVSRLSGWKAVVAATAVFGATSLALILIKRKLDGNAKRVTSGSSTSTSDDAPPALESVSTKPLPSLRTEMEFGEICSQFLQKLGEEEAVEPREEKRIRQALPTVLAQFSNEARALASHFLLATHAYHLTHSESEEEFNQLMQSQLVDMKVAWDLLACKPQSDEQLRALDVMRLQVAQCLRDASLMIQVFDRMISRGMKDFTGEEVTLLFTTAPLLGRWEQTVQLGDNLIEKQFNLEEFHHAPMDFHVLYEIAKTERQRGNAPNAQLQWRNYRITMQRIKLRHAVCEEDEEIVKSLENEFQHEGARTWKMLQPSEASRLVRCGALCQLRSFTPVALALVGPASESRIFVKGHGLMGNAQQNPVATQSETCDLTRVQAVELEGGDGSSDSAIEGAMHWKGTFQMQQEATEDIPVANRIPTLNATFDLEMTIVPI